MEVSNNTLDDVLDSDDALWNWHIVLFLVFAVSVVGLLIVLQSFLCAYACRKTYTFQRIRACQCLERRQT